MKNSNETHRPFSYSTKEPGSSDIFYTILYARFDRVALELRSQLCTFENSINCDEISFDPHSFSELLKGLWSVIMLHKRSAV